MQGQGVATARISGTLTDDSGAALVGAPGRFVIVDLAIASYDVLASSPNLESVVRSGVVFTVSASAGLDFRLKVASARKRIRKCPGFESRDSNRGSLLARSLLN